MIILIVPGTSFRSSTNFGYRRGVIAAIAESNLDDDANQRLLNQANAWCGLNGLMYSDGDKNWNMAPIALVPNQFSRESFEYAQNVQPIINVLIDMISRDRDFLLANLLSVANSDAFTKRLLDIYSTLPLSVVKETVHLGLHRSDYMLNVDTNSGEEQPLQVEMNTIASSFGCLSKKVGDFHRFLLSRNTHSSALNVLLSATAPELMNHSDRSDTDTSSSGVGAGSTGRSDGNSNVVKDLVGRIPENRSTRMLAMALAMAHFLYGDNQAVVLFVVQPGERNIGDQRSLEAELWNVHGVRVEFKTLAEISARGRVDNRGTLYIDNADHRPVAPTPGGDTPSENTPSDSTPSGGDSNNEGLMVDPSDKKATEQVVSLVYYRAGYAPNDYPTETEWVRGRDLDDIPSNLNDTSPAALFLSRCSLAPFLRPLLYHLLHSRTLLYFHSHFPSRSLPYTSPLLLLSLFLFPPPRRLV